MRRTFAAFWTFFAAGAVWAGNVPAGPSLPASYLPVPITLQATSYSCGAAAMLGVLNYWKAFEGMEADLYPPLGTTPKDGTDPRVMAAAARKFGLSARLREGLTQDDLADALAKGITVILDLQAWPDGALPKGGWADLWESGHYVVLIGMDTENVYVMDPSLTAGYGFIPRTELDERWHDYEDRDGKMWRNQHLGLLLSGKEHLAAYPAPLERVR